MVQDIATPTPKVKSVKKYVLSVQKTATEIPQEVARTSHECSRILKRIHLQEGNHIQEFFYCLFLNRANMPTGYYLVSMGGITGTVADPRLILKAAVLADCTNIVLCHNHPSGSLQPSKADEELTTKIRHAASYLDIRVLDHVILTEDNGYYSFADEGLI